MTPSERMHKYHNPEHVAFVATNTITFRAVVVSIVTKPIIVTFLFCVYSNGAYYLVNYSLIYN